MRSSLRAFACGMIAGLVGIGLHWAWTLLMGNEPSGHEAGGAALAVGVVATLLFQLAVTVVASVIGVLIGFKLSPGKARQLGVVPGFLLGLAFWSKFGEMGVLPWCLLSLAPGLASGGAAVALSSNLASRNTAPPPLQQDGAP